MAPAQPFGANRSFHRRLLVALLLLAVLVSIRVASGKPPRSAWDQLSNFVQSAGARMQKSRHLWRRCLESGCRATVRGHSRLFLIGFFLCAAASVVRGDDIVLQWNDTMRQAMQLDRTKPDPGWSSRAMAMVNGAIYDSFMAIDRTHSPFLVNTTAPGDTSRDAAATQAAYLILNATYPGQSSLFDATRTAALAAIPEGPTKTAGLSLGASVASQYLAARANDGADSICAVPPHSRTRTLASRSAESRPTGLGTGLGAGSAICDDKWFTVSATHDSCAVKPAIRRRI